MKLTVLSLDAKPVEEIEVKGIEEDVRADLLIRAVRADMSKTYQPKAPYRYAGIQTSAEYIGNKDKYRSMKNRGAAMLPHEKLPKGRIGRVRRIPFAVTGRRAHPPKVEKVLVEKMNKKEYMKALRSAVSGVAAMNKMYVIVDDVESMSKTKQVLSLFNALGVGELIDKAYDGRRRITGVRCRRKGRAYREKKIALVIPSKDCKLANACRGIPGVDAKNISQLKVMDVAPGGQLGRVLILSKSALLKLG
ncbi:MAG: 50S ribosomal protein L4, partial [Candidatus Micrarchaeia archaeon]